MRRLQDAKVFVNLVVTFGKKRTRTLQRIKLFSSSAVLKSGSGGVVLGVYEKSVLNVCCITLFAYVNAAAMQTVIYCR